MATTDTTTALLLSSSACPPLLYDSVDMYLDGAQAIADVLACCDLGGCADNTISELAFLQGELLRAARIVACERRSVVSTNAIAA